MTWQYTADFVPNPDALFATVRDEVPWTQQMASRQTASMGRPYNYSGASYPVAPWHPAVADLARAVKAAVGFTPTNCLLNSYPTGQHSLGWHADDITILAPNTGIAIVSVGVERALGLRHGGPDEFTYQELPLAPGSLLYMSQAMQADWRHRLKRTPGAGHRISLSFRHII
ncbi:MAG: alkylated DNA repair dioxygenase AlkB [Myxococcota bacterium]